METPPHVTRPLASQALALLQAALIVVAGWYVYSPALRGDWLWDDQVDIVRNPLLRDVAGLGRIWVAPTSVNYFPLKSTVQWLQWQLWQDHPAGYHWTNLGLHLLSALLLWRLLGRLGARQAWLGGLLFAVHPLAVESVAWIAELKNTASLSLLLLAADACLDFDERGRTRDRVRAVLLFLAAMLCKTTVAMFPAGLLLHAWWRRGRISRADLRASTPFFAISLVLGIVAIWFEHHRSIGSTIIPVGGLLSRVAGAGLSIGFYFVKAVFPAGLMPIYPLWEVDPPSPLQFLPWLVVGAVGWLLWKQRTAWGRHALFGGGWFLLNLLPVLGFITMAFQRISWVSDHFAYVSLAGLIGLVVAGIGAIADRLTGLARSGVFAAVGVIMALCVHEGRTYAAIFRDETAFWGHAVQHNPQAWMAHYNLGNALAPQGRLTEASGHYRQTLQLKPDHDEAHNNLGNVLLLRGRIPEAIAEFEAALRLKPASADAHMNLGSALVQSHRASEALAHYEQALQLQPGSAKAHYNLANALASQGRLREASEHYEAALRLEPASSATHYNLGNALAQSGRLPDAIAHYEQALRLKPDSAEVHANLGNALAQSGHWTEAIQHYEAALRLDPNDAVTRANLDQVRQQAHPRTTNGHE